MIYLIRKRILAFLSVLYAMRWLRRTVIALAIAIAAFTVAGFFGVPPLLRHILTGPVAARLHRPVTVGAITFNPYTLRLEVSHLEVEGRATPGMAAEPPPFATVGHLHVRAAWMSLIRLAPVLREIHVDAPSLNIVRDRQGAYNFADLLTSSSPTPTRPSGHPQRFAISNIQITAGEIRFADLKFGTHHTIRNLELDIPFIANLPSDVDIFVRPLLSMDVDGSPFRVFGRTRPFGATQEAVANVKLNALDLTRVAAYVPPSIPIRLMSGKLSVDLTIEFADLNDQRLIRMSGLTALDGLDIRDSTGAPLVAIAHTSAQLDNVQPLGGIVRLGKITVEGLTSYGAMNPDGSFNFTPLMGHGGAPPPAPAQPGTSAPMHLSIASFDLSNSTIEFTDRGINPPAQVIVGNLHFGFTGLNLPGHGAVPFTAGANLANGAMAVSGSYDLAQKQGAANVTLTNLRLPVLRDFARPMLAAQLASGQLNTALKVSMATNQGRTALQVQSLTAAVDDFQLRDAAGMTNLVRWTRFSFAAGPIDMAARQAAIQEVRFQGLNLDVKRARDGQINLLSVLHPTGASTPATTQTPPPPPASPPWRYRIASVAIEDSGAEIQDEQGPAPVKLTVAALNLHLKDVSNDLSKPIALALAAKIDKGSIKASGTAVPAPLAANLRITTDRLDLTPAGILARNRINATLAGGFLTSNGACEVSDERGGFRMGYRGDVIVGGLRLLDRVTRAPFVRWRTLGLHHLDVATGRGAPSVRVEQVALDDFYGRIILYSSGRLNLADILVKAGAAPTSLTSAQPPAVAPERPAGPGAKIDVGGVLLQGGNINWTDNFIKPNYSANLTDIHGKIGGFGTAATAPADVAVEGRINQSAPLDISGKINPLAPTASIDITGKAEGIGLPSLTPYSTKYTGYPIEKGTLSFDVHYLLKDQRLRAENHILIRQLTFGNRVESRSTINLPIRLAVSLLEDANGNISVDVPVSGSLNDPDFSLSQALFQAFTNLIIKVATSPFKLLASAFGGLGAAGQDLGYIVFQPGRAALSPTAIKKLTTLTSAMKNRPKLQLDITGRVDPSVDLEGLRKAMVDRRVRQQKIRELIAEGKNENLAQVTVAPDEYDKYLKLAYKAAKFDKPRNFLGLDKSLPPDQMKKLLLDHTQVTEADLHQLAQRRADAVRNWLSKDIQPSRLFVVTPKLNANGLKGQTDTTRVDLSLS